ncbi:MerR family transcriptional regulator [Brachybacterium sacelli]|uniref:DNA-binding transcriptional MerR regulator n=2 Tax=Brachybacterium sacelli TaxID=173364 RepID=A0ABS4X0N4_9MICO|nr:MerR family transcriptional regulator [Brachybacterium sacelli]MBP2382026.1 DNA-binding transcriptional MerR regulator [Brachybacterium sacelli]
MRPVDLARRHDLSAQAVRNYESAGALPPAERTSAGHRRYTARHARALRAFLSLRRAVGHRAALDLLSTLHGGDLEGALTLLGRAHEQLLRDRTTLTVVERAVGDLEQGEDRGRPPRTLWIGELAARLGLSPATLRHWERFGLLAPSRERVSGHRLYPPSTVHDAELVHLLRRGGHRLGDIAEILGQVRTMGENSSVHTALTASRERVTARGIALLEASAALADHVRDGAASLGR